MNTAIKLNTNQNSKHQGKDNSKILQGNSDAVTNISIGMTEQEYHVLNSFADELIESAEDLTLRNETLLKMLLGAIESYEERKIRENFRERYQEDLDQPPHIILQELMKAEGLSQKDLTQFFGGHRSNTSAVINGKRSISKAQAKALAEYFDVTPSLFIFGGSECE